MINKLNSENETAADNAQLLFDETKKRVVAAGIPEAFLASAEQKLPFSIGTHHGSDALTEMFAPAGLFAVIEQEGSQVGIISVKETAINKAEQSITTLFEEYIHYLHAAHNSAVKQHFAESERRDLIISKYEELKTSDVEIKGLFGLEDDVNAVLDLYLGIYRTITQKEFPDDQVRYQSVVQSFSYTNITLEEALEIASKLAAKINGRGTHYDYMGTGTELNLSQRLDYINNAPQEEDLASEYRESIHYGLLTDIGFSLETNLISTEELQDILTTMNIEQASILPRFTTLMSELRNLDRIDLLRYVTALVTQMTDRQPIYQLAVTLESLTTSNPVSSLSATEDVEEIRAKALALIDDMRSGRSEVSSLSGSTQQDRILVSAISTSIRNEFKNASLRSLILENVSMARNEWSPEQTVSWLSDPTRREEYIKSVIENSAGYFPSDINFEDFMTIEGWEKVNSRLAVLSATLSDDDSAFIANLLMRTRYVLTSQGGDLTEAMYLGRDRRNNPSVVDSFTLREAKEKLDIDHIKTSLLLEPIAKVIRHRIKFGKVPQAQEIMTELNRYNGLSPIIGESEIPVWINQIISFVEIVFNKKRFGDLTEFFSLRTFTEQLRFLKRYNFS